MRKSRASRVFIHHASLITHPSYFLFNSSQVALDLFGLGAGQVVRAVADAVVGARDGEHLWTADRLGEFERRLVGAARESARGERRRHAPVELDDGAGRLLVAALRAATRASLTAKPQQPDAREQERRGREHEGRRYVAERAREPAALA